jgi:hypothetical protein
MIIVSNGNNLGSLADHRFFFDLFRKKVNERYVKEVLMIEILQ